MQNAPRTWALALSLIAASFGMASAPAASAQPGHGGNGPPVFVPGPHVPPPVVHGPAMPTNPNSRYGQPPRHWSLDRKAWYRHAERCERRYRNYSWRLDRYIDAFGRSRRCLL